MFKSDFSLFLGQMIRRPRQVVALAPSSVGLCMEMAAQIDPDGGPVIELGAGTGAITQAILERGLRASDLHAIEMNPEFCTHLKDRFAGLNLYQMTAQDVGALPVRGAQAVVSGLPLLSMPVDVQRAIVTGSFACLAPGASLVQFTYGPTPPIAPELREDLALDWSVSNMIWRNMPPARVYRFFRCPTRH
jgi:phosphatidylethanolamine/phosphatidyl-N-methylethanolamine N-methyltransferase